MQLQTTILYFCLGSKNICHIRNNVHSDFDSKKFVDIIRKTKWNDVYQENNTETALDSFSAQISECISQCPSESTVKQWFRTPRNPWITKELMRSIMKKGNLHRKLKAEPYNYSPRCWLKTYANILGAALKHAQCKYCQNKVKNNSDNTNQKWQAIKQPLQHQ